MSEKSALTSGWAARQYTKNLTPFHNNANRGLGPKGATLWGENTNGFYVVYSYNRDWPLFANWKGIWFSNKDKISPTTSKHYSQANPLVPCVPLDVSNMRCLIKHGMSPEHIVMAAQMKIVPNGEHDWVGKLEQFIEGVKL
jgi:hypothetical protein